MNKPHRRFLKSKRLFRRRLPPIQSGDRIDYSNTSLIIRFISEQGKILSRRVTRLTLKQQRLITIAIKQARILSLIPFRTRIKANPFKKEKPLKKNKWRNSRRRTRKNRVTFQLNQKSNPSSN